MNLPRKSSLTAQSIALVAFVCSALAAVYLWMGTLVSEGMTTSTPEGYYAKMTDAFLSGQLHLKLQPDPRLKTLANPWRVVPGQNIPRRPETVYFNGQYYLYFSATPTVFLFAPWKLVTGSYLTDEAGTLILSLAGFVMIALIVWTAWLRWFRQLSPVWPAFALTAAALGTRIPQMMTAPIVHHVPVVAAHAFSMAAIFAVLWALGRPSWRGQALGLALASLGWGLAVTCRPNYIFSLPALVIPLWFFGWAGTAGETERWRRRGWLFGATLFPAACVGAAQAAYNYARFADIAEFGVRYYVGGIDQLTLQTFGAANFWPNFQLFFLTLPAAAWFSSSFPFFSGWLDYQGVLIGAPFVLVAAGFPLVWLNRDWREERVLFALGLTLWVTFVLNALSILLLTLLVGVAERYVVDFMPLAGVLAALTVFVVMAGKSRGLGGRLARCGVGVLLLASLLNSALAVFMRSGPAERMRPLGRLANRAVHRIEQLRGIQYGPLVFQIRFEQVTPGRREPLLVSGQGNDVLFVEFVGPGELRIGFCHRGAHPVFGPVVKVAMDRSHELVADLGNLYPPKDHPLVTGLPDDVTDILRHRLVVALDGQTVLESGSAYYPTSPGAIELGRNPGGFMTDVSFSGRIDAVSRQAIPTLATLRGPALSGPIRLELRIPDFSGYHTEPLLSSGPWGGGDLIYLTYVAPGKIRFGHDSWGGGAIESRVLTYDPAQAQILEIETPALGRDFAGSSNEPLRLVLNGQLVFADARPFNASRQAAVFLGFNGCNSSTSSLSFSGTIVSVTPAAGARVVAKSGSAVWGALRVQLRFPAQQYGRREPLLVTGRNGAGDVIYVQYVDDSHIRVGYDHWNKGGPVSDLIAVDFRTIQNFEISLGSLYPPLADAGWGDLAEADRRSRLGTVSVHLNGQPVLSVPETAYPATGEEIQVGLNAIGATTSDRLFSGEILRMERVPFAER